MTVQVERTFDVEAPPEEVWELLSDPANRARAISIVESFDVEDEETIWQIRLPIPMVRRTVPVRTRDVERRPPEFVKFVGRSKVMNVTGEHEIEETDAGSRVYNRFVVDGKLPGVEKFFVRNIDDEIENILGTVSGRVTAVEEV